MKLSMLALAAGVAICAGAFGTGKALATITHRAAPQTLRIVMHDPGCHWFQIGGKFTRTATVTGSVRLVDMDETTLKVASRSGMRYIRVGKSLTVKRGNYVIMMVGQAVDDNYLKLTVR
jgi:hypothetical protein